jgi:hypothetical protein
MWIQDGDSTAMAQLLGIHASPAPRAREHVVLDAGAANRPIKGRAGHRGLRAPVGNLRRLRASSVGLTVEAAACSGRKPGDMGADWIGATDHPWSGWISPLNDTTGAFGSKPKLLGGSAIGRP